MHHIFQHWPRTVRTSRGQRRLSDPIHMSRYSAMRGRMSRLPARFLGLGFGRAFRKRRRLPLAGPQRCFELGFKVAHYGVQIGQPLLQFGVLRLQPLVVCAKVVSVHEVSLSTIQGVRNSTLSPLTAAQSFSQDTVNKYGQPITS